MTRALRLTREDVRRFAGASGDRNPLHVDELYARATPYGRCISHGALATIAALGIADPETLRDVSALSIQFKQPIFPDEDYTVALAGSDGDTERIDVLDGGRVAVAIALTRGGGAPLPDVPASVTATLRTEPKQWTLEELSTADPALQEPYACDLDALRTLARRLGAGSVPDALMLWVAAASYTVGMVVPGEDAVFVGGRIVRSTAPGSGMLSGSVAVVDDRTGFVTVDVAVEQRDASAQLSLHAFLRQQVPPPDRASIEQYLPPSSELTGRKILVVGGSRGLGAALAGAFATQGATVWVAYARSRRHAEALRTEFGTDAIRLLEFDAEDAEQARQAFATLRTEAGHLDGVVLCAAPPLYETSLHPGASLSTLRFVQSSVAMTLVPLAESLQVLAADGWLIVVSSSTLDGPPEAWPHYTTAKAALEGAASYCERHGGARVLVVRAPKMWTDSTNTPLGRLGAVPKEQVAAAIVRRVMNEDGPRSTLLTAEELAASAVQLGLDE